MNVDLARPYRSIWALTWPQLLMMVFQFLIGVADVAVCARIGREAQAAMGLVSQAMFLFLTVAIAVSNGSVAALTQSLGAGRALRAARYAGLCLFSGLGLGVAVFAAGFGLEGPFLKLLNVPGEMLAPTREILGIFLWLLPVNYLFLVSNAVLRSHKIVMAPLLAVGVGCAVNAVLDYGLGLGLWGLPALGVAGVAWATVGSMTLGLCCNLVWLRRAGILSRSMLAPWRWTRVAWRYVFRVAWPSGLMQVVWHSGYTVLLAIAGGLPSGGVEALAAFAAGSRVESGIFLPAFAFNMSASILVGHALGQGNPAEARRMGFRVLGLGVAAMSLMALCLWPFLPSISAVFAPDAGVAAEARLYLVYNLLAVPFTCTGMILAGALTGAGATVYNLIVFGASIWGVRLPVAWWLGWRAWGTAEGVWLSMLVSQVFQALALLAVYRFRDWARFSMIKPRTEREKSL
ncbi:putative FMN/FAD exporter YeeO [Fundidesulfovibrio magnetotacticus]|uniref:Multidrug-efflux transporter n=1 Tax=Fundidesulfovibrio magnetotacticus TaxID=2730080 RepID=A0A6V8LST0_9BACT|nr:MATE family efflux transporter [Fundidesulfovibrio magnetotacticus]GFK93641.1 putative FMN/FAD exporter YeeO [Fundidesulfovibrio magnetotacticus]